MYVQFNAIDREKLNEALKILNRDGNDMETYQKALGSALSVLNNSRPEEGRSLEWAAEMIPAYKEIGRSLVKYMAHAKRDELVSQLLEIEKEFSATLGEYDGDDVVENIRLVLKNLENLPDDVLKAYQERSLTGKIASALKDFDEIQGIINRYELKDEGDLEAALKERDELREQADFFKKQF